MRGDDILSTQPGELGKKLVAEARERELEAKREARRAAYGEAALDGERHSPPVTTRRSPPSATRGASVSARDVALLEAAGRIAGEMAARVRHELDREIADLRAQLAELKRELAAAKGLRAVA